MYFFLLCFCNQLHNSRAINISYKELSRVVQFHQQIFKCYVTDYFHISLNLCFECGKSFELWASLGIQDCLICGNFYAFVAGIYIYVHVASSGFHSYPAQCVYVNIYFSLMQTYFIWRSISLFLSWSQGCANLANTHRQINIISACNRICNIDCVSLGTIFGFALIENIIKLNEVIMFLFDYLLIDEFINFIKFYNSLSCYSYRRQIDAHNFLTCLTFDSGKSLQCRLSAASFTAWDYGNLLCNLILSLEIGALYTVLCSIPVCAISLKVNFILFLLPSLCIFTNITRGFFLLF